MNKVTRFIILVAVILVVGLLVRYTPLSQYFTKEHVVAFLESLRGQWWGPLIFIVICRFTRFAANTCWRSRFWYGMGNAL